MDILTNFAEVIDEYLIKEGMNRFEFSKRAGISNLVVSSWVNQRFMPSAESVITLTQLYDKVKNYDMFAWS